MLFIVFPKSETEFGARERIAGLCGRCRPEMESGSDQ